MHVPLEVAHKKRARMIPTNSVGSLWARHVLFHAAARDLNLHWGQIIIHLAIVSFPAVAIIETGSMSRKCTEWLERISEVDC